MIPIIIQTTHALEESDAIALVNAAILITTFFYVAYIRTRSLDIISLLKRKTRLH